MGSVESDNSQSVVTALEVSSLMLHPASAYVEILFRSAELVGVP
jgi:hypothetical protein